MSIAAKNRVSVFGHWVGLPLKGLKVTSAAKLFFAIK